MRRKIVAIFVFLTACSENDPVFKIEDTFLVSRFNKFVEVAETFYISVPRNNMILRYVSDDNTSSNESRAYKDGDQLRIDIDQKFVELHSINEDRLQFILFQQFANGLMGTPFRDCGLMKQVKTASDTPADPQMDHATYPNLFDPSSPCL